MICFAPKGFFLISRPVSPYRTRLLRNACHCLWSYRIFPFLSCATPILSRRTASHCQWGRNQVYPLPAASSAVRAPLWCYALHFPGGGSASRKARRRSFSFRLCLSRRQALLVLVYKCGQKKLNNLYYQVKEQRSCSIWQKTKNPTLRNSSSRS